MHGFLPCSEAEGMRLLVVDDDLTVRRIIRTVLAKQGHEISEAGDGLQGLALAKQHPCDLVITDEIMPLLNGQNMISRLAAERYPARYLLISGYHLDQPVQCGVAFLRKPFTAGQLIEVVQRLQHEPTLPELEKKWLLEQEQWREALTEFREVISDVPSQIPHSNEALRIERATLKQNTAYERYSQVFHNYKEALQVYGLWE
jgi:YesN/AraC family two-component response regulator